MQGRGVQEGGAAGESGQKGVCVLQPQSHALHTPGTLSANAGPAWHGIHLQAAIPPNPPKPLCQYPDSWI